MYIDRRLSLLFEIVSIWTHNKYKLLISLWCGGDEIDVKINKYCIFPELLTFVLNINTWWSETGNLCISILFNPPAIGWKFCI